MQLADQRKLGVKLATEFDAPRTLTLIKNAASSYREIFETAAEELGANKLAELVLEQDDPTWALAVLRHVPEARDTRDALMAKAASFADNVKQVETAEATAASLGNVAAFELDVVAGASYSAYFTMYWQNEPNVTQPKAGYGSKTPPYQWSYIVRVGQATQNLCGFFALPGAPLNAGATVWMVVDVCGGGWYETPYTFTYQPTGDTAVISADGGTVTASFKWKMKT